jgi:hypothetical protein
MWVCEVVEVDILPGLHPRMDLALYQHDGTILVGLVVLIRNL